MTTDRAAERTTEWVLAVERAYVAAAVDRAHVAAAVERAGTAAAVDPDAAPAGPRSDSPSKPGATALELVARAEAAAAAVASRFLAVAAPRSFGLVIDVATQVEAAALALAAHRTWFDPREVRCAAVGGGAEALAAATGGRVASLDEALACDIICVLAAYVRVAPASLRRGTHVNVSWGGVLDEELRTLATILREAQLPELAAGLIDGRQLDEITIFVIDGAPTALAAITALTTPTALPR